MLQSTTQNKPPMDLELRSTLDKVDFPPISTFNAEIITMMRAATATPASFIDEQKARGISHREVRIPSQDDSGHEIVLSILQQISKSAKPRPSLYWIHGGAYHWGDRLHTLEFATETILECDAICISVEYRLSPEHPYTTSVEDCYTGLQWVSSHMNDLGIDPENLMIGGISAGGGLAAAVSLLCRDRQGPILVGQCLVCPSVDDRMSTVSSHQYVAASDFLPRPVLVKMWESAHAKDPLDSTRISPPAHVEDLSGLPTTYLDVGSAEVLRDETVAHASKLWASGVQAELHVWSGGFHGFDIFLPDAAVSQASRKAKLAWTKRTFGIN